MLLDLKQLPIWLDLTGLCTRCAMWIVATVLLGFRWHDKWINISLQSGNPPFLWRACGIDLAIMTFSTGQLHLGCVVLCLDYDHLSRWLVHHVGGNDIFVTSLIMFILILSRYLSQQYPTCSFNQLKLEKHSVCLPVVIDPLQLWHLLYGGYQVVFLLSWLWLIDGVHVCVCVCVCCI